MDNPADHLMKVRFERHNKTIMTNGDNSVLDYRTVPRHQLTQSGMDPFSEASECLPHTEEGGACMVADMPLIIKRMANLPQQDTKISQTRQPAIEEEGMAGVALGITAQTLKNLETSRHFQKLRGLEVKAFDLERSQEGTYVRNCSKGWLLTSGQQRNHL
jgi:hypothetical protein